MPNGNHAPKHPTDLLHRFRKRRRGTFFFGIAVTSSLPAMAWSGRQVAKGARSANTLSQLAGRIPPDTGRASNRRPGLKV